MYTMANLTRAHDELFRRTADETFPSLAALTEHCQRQRDESVDRWERPQEVLITSDLTLGIDDCPDYRLNDWSFTQMCRLAGVSKDTVNRLSLKTASHVLRETLPTSDKPMQLLTTGDLVRSVHGVAYTRLWNTEILAMLAEFATDFQPPQQAEVGGTGLYCGEQDLFVFLIDPTGWAEINGEAFAPGFFVWNSEVGRRSLGIQTFWFQACCKNHIVWDATEVVEFTRKHTANVRDGLGEIRRIVEALVAKRDARRDGFVSVLKKAMQMRLGDDADEVAETLLQNGIPRGLAKQALEIAQQQGAFTIFSLVDALTRLTQAVTYVGDRTEHDAKIGNLLALAA
jgi:hypothetical protein